MKDLFYMNFPCLAGDKSPLSMSDEEFSAYLNSISSKKIEEISEEKSLTAKEYKECVELRICYFSGEFFVGVFANESEAQKYYDENKGEFWDYRANCYGTPIFDVVSLNLVDEVAEDVNYD